MSQSSVSGKVFGVVAHGQSYLNILYLLLAFPLGTAYFIFLVTGLALGFGLFITLVGIPILLLVLGGSWVLCSIERWLARTLLNEPIPFAPSHPASKGVWPRLRAHLGNRVTWTGVLYLMLKFPIGIASFVIVTTLVAITLSMLTAPIYRPWAEIDLWVWYVDDLWETFLCTLIGIPLLFISLHVMNWAAFVSGKFARVMLGKSQDVASA